ncbi:MAG TPA: hypothetical protein ENI52_04845 [Thermoplasmata archaeon]|nr:hypothetical protein [Thermoplasmata archaeon]
MQYFFMKCGYCGKNIDNEEIFKDGKYWHRECFRKWLREKGC